MARIRDGAPELWEVVNTMIEECIERGILIR
jgi:hypothetical protein